jgi:alginate O-acetyltransferase complex protein AlgI
MLFNSAGFLIIFLPLTLAAFSIAVRLRSTAIAVAVLLCASYAFYGWWEPPLCLLLVASTAFNYAVGRSLTWADKRHGPAGRQVLLWMGIVANLGLLGYFKYAGFFAANLQRLTELPISLPEIALPIGISFYTFTQIAFLVDTARADTGALRLPDYFLFVSYFPHLIAGPIIHHRGTIPQFRSMATESIDLTAVSIGLSIFTIGLFKKIMIADNVAPFADAIFSHLETTTPTLVDGWIGALAYSFQIYFDFSGYSDMAIGLSLLFGVRLPLNFASPYKATSIVDFWQRWHMSLSQFLRDYLYIPLGGNRRGPTRRYINLMATMLLGGLWHGAGWTFVLWGGLHGFYLVINHALRHLQPIAAHSASPAWRTWSKRVVVLIAVTVAWVLFRSESLGSALAMLGGMAGAHGLGTPADHLIALSWLAACFLIVWGLPNTYEIFARYRPVLPVRLEIAEPASHWLEWRLCVAYAIGTAAALATCILTLDRYSPFLYYRF